MDPLSIIASSIAILELITTTSRSIASFIRSVRDSRSDLDEVDRELQSIRRILELLQEDLAAQDDDEAKVGVPSLLGGQILGILQGCQAAITQVEGTVERCRNSINRSAGSQFIWALTGKADIQKCRDILEPNRRALEISVDILTWSTTRDIKDNTNAILDDTAIVRQNTNQILEQIQQLRQQLPRRMASLGDDSACLPDMYLQNLATYTESILSIDSEGKSVGGPAFSHRTRAGILSLDSTETLTSSLSLEPNPSTQGPDADMLLVSIVDRMGFSEPPSALPKSFQLALQNRFTREELEESQRVASSIQQAALPIFFAGAFIFPATVAAVTGMDLTSAIKRMTPAVLKSYRRHAVDPHAWPALYPSGDYTDEVLGVMVFATTPEQRRRLHRFQGGLLERSRAVADVLATDGSTVSHGALVYVWNRPSSMLVPTEQKRWSPSDMLQSEWLGASHRAVTEEETALSNMDTDKFLAGRKAADILMNSETVWPDDVQDVEPTGTQPSFKKTYSKKLGTGGEERTGKSSKTMRYKKI